MRKKNLVFSRIEDLDKGLKSTGEGLKSTNESNSDTQSKLISELEKIQVKPKYIKINFKK